MDEKNQVIFRFIYGEESLPQIRKSLSSDINDLNVKCELLVNEWKDQHYVDNITSNYYGRNPFFYKIIKKMSWPW